MCQALCRTLFTSIILLDPHNNSKCLVVLSSPFSRKVRYTEFETSFKMTQQMKSKASSQSSEPANRLPNLCLPLEESLLDSPAFANSYYLHSINNPSSWSISLQEKPEDRLSDLDGNNEIKFIVSEALLSSSTDTES